MASPGELERHISWWRPKFAGLHLSQMAISHEGKHRETVRLNQNVLRVPKVLETMRKPAINHNFSISLDSTHAINNYMSDHSCCDVRLDPQIHSTKQHIPLGGDTASPALRVNPASLHLISGMVAKKRRVFPKVQMFKRFWRSYYFSLVAIICYNHYQSLLIINNQYQSLSIIINQY